MCCITFNIPHGLSGKNKIDYKVERKPHRPSVGSHSFIHSCIHLFIHLFVYAGLYICWSSILFKFKIWRRARIEPRPHWWEASALTTAPSLLPENANLVTRAFPLTFGKEKALGTRLRGKCNKIISKESIEF